MGIPITYFRSSSYNSHEFCNHQYFMEYVLGLKSVVGIAADKGTIVHKVMEVLGHLKVAQMNNKCDEDSCVVEDEIFGSAKRLVQNPDTMTIDDLNYIFICAYNFYSRKYAYHNWTQAHLNECWKWVLEATTYNNGEFHPFNRDIIGVEQRFDFTLDKPWSKYNYNGEEGHLAMRGTIDLVTRIKPGAIEVIDWKTGARKDWGTGKKKDYNYLLDDAQLRIYHMAIDHMYPDEDVILMTIFFIKDGGPFTIPFTKKDIIKTEGMIKEKFIHIQRTARPKLHKGWHCHKFCYFGTHNPQGGKIKPGEDTMCNHLHNKVMLQGIDTVITEDTKEGYSMNYYSPPGE